jgi:uncharacterized membrane protein
MKKRALSPVSFLVETGVVLLVVGALSLWRGEPYLDLLVLGVLCFVAAWIWRRVARSRERPRFRDERLEEVHARDSVELIWIVVAFLALFARFIALGSPAIGITYIVMAILGTFVALRLIKSTTIRHPRRRSRQA